MTDVKFRCTGCDEVPKVIEWEDEQEPHANLVNFVRPGGVLADSNFELQVLQIMHTCQSGGLHCCRVYVNVDGQKKELKAVPAYYTKGIRYDFKFYIRKSSGADTPSEPFEGQTFDLGDQSAQLEPWSGRIIESLTLYRHASGKIAMSAKYEATEAPGSEMAEKSGPAPVDPDHEPGDEPATDTSKAGTEGARHPNEASPEPPTSKAEEPEEHPPRSRTRGKRYIESPKESSEASASSTGESLDAKRPHERFKLSPHAAYGQHMQVPQHTAQFTQPSFTPQQPTLQRRRTIDPYAPQGQWFSQQPAPQRQHTMSEYEDQSYRVYGSASRAGCAPKEPTVAPSR